MNTHATGVSEPLKTFNKTAVFELNTCYYLIDIIQQSPTSMLIHRIEATKT